MASLLPSPIHLVPLAQALGITAPAVYAAITYSYNVLVLPPLLAYADDERRLAKQWLRAYQYGPVFVPPLLLTSTVTNGALAGWAFARWIAAGEYGSGVLGVGAGSGSGSGSLWALGAGIAHAAAVLAFGAIVPYTLAGMEKQINGAAKWKVQMLLAPAFSTPLTEKGRQEAKLGHADGLDEQKKWVMEEGTSPSAFKQSARRDWRVWAEGATMREIVMKWGKWNAVRVPMTILSFVTSTLGMCLSVWEAGK
ncbi:hypothetical protein EV356DRAFT_518969 [Viridothelium virens]|uniref:Uncharacterized protein n=1 Tax=Viridothelium virens TaxID=1048519 RepID=A0A6A6HK65_VIRVR|nr:hypothetical protein EV356DRAFT_518969 [Viridothelium virens]